MTKKPVIVRLMASTDTPRSLEMYGIAGKKMKALICEKKPAKQTIIAMAWRS